jgi:methionine-rich copper-binding protein CopC
MLQRSHGPIRLFVLVAAVLTALASPLELAAHLAVARTSPADNAALKSSPGRVQVWFTQPPSEKVSRLELHGSAGEVALGETAVNQQDRSISAAVPGALKPGSYEVRWRTAGNDGHVMRGAFRFSIES